MFVTPKNRLMSITNALATQKYTAYSTTIDLDKAKVEEDGTILAGSPYPYSYTEGGGFPPVDGGGDNGPPEPMFPYRNYIYDSSYQISEFIESYNNPAGTYRNVYYDKFSLIHNITGGLTTTMMVDGINTRIVINLSNSYSQNPVVYHFYIMHDLVEPIDLSKKWNLSGLVESNIDLTNYTTFFSTTNTRGNRTGSFSTTIHERKVGAPAKTFNVNNTWDSPSPEGTFAYAICFGFQGTVRPKTTIEIDFKNFMLSEGLEPSPYYPAEEDYASYIQTARSLANIELENEPVIAEGLMFNDINVKKELEEGIKAVTGKLITGGYVLESRLPYPIDEASKENLKMIRFR